MQTGSEMLEKY